MNQNHYPTEWQKVPLAYIANWGSGGTPSRKNPEYYDGNIPWIKTGDLGPRVILAASEYITDLGVQKSSAKSFPKGSVAMAMYGATIGKVSILGIDTTTNQACAVGQPIAGVTDSSFLYYLLRNEKNAFIAKGKGGAQPNISQTLIKEHPVALPPLAEQKTIADKLDTLLAQVENTKAHLECVPKILKRFRQSVLAAAVSGRLTEEWRESTTVSESVHELLSRWERNRQQHFFETQRELLELRKIKKAKKFKQPSKPDTDTAGAFNIPAEWLVVSVSQFAECLDSQRVPVKKEDRKSAIGLYPYFGANGQVDRVDDYIFDGDFVLVTEDETFYGREKPIAYRYSGKCWVNNHAHILQAETKDANGYLFYSLMHYNVIPWLSGTTGRAKLTQAALNTLPLGLPPEAEISEIVRRIDQLFAHADRIEQQVNNALARVNSLTQSILAKAFRGELTEQWRKDNPELISGENSAAALLERIKVERAAMKPTSAARKRKTSA